MGDSLSYLIVSCPEENKWTNKTNLTFGGLRVSPPTIQCAMRIFKGLFKFAIPACRTSKPSLLKTGSLKLLQPSAHDVEFLGKFHYLMICVSRDASFCQSVYHFYYKLLL